jgi:Txe/YoeB family toxin of Txe-Axe toxin-antitoxin module
MMSKQNVTYLLVIALCFLKSITFGAIPEASEMEKEEYKQELNRIKSLKKSLKPGKTNDLKNYEKFADEIQSKWSRRNREHNARLILEVCGPLSSGGFKDDRRYEVARKYALSALERPEEISLEIELELTGHVVTLMCTRCAPKGADFAQRRKKDVEIRLHAWKRLTDAIDTTWDPNDLPLLNVTPPLATGMRAGIAPEAIKDPTLRTQYEAAITKNRQKAERHRKQSKLRTWLKRFPKKAEEYVVQAYCKPPFNLDELRQYLAKYIVDSKTKARILDTVTKNMENAIKRNSSTQ